jgi:hypothetical protein
MGFLPYERIKISTRLSSQEVLKRLEKVVQPNRPWGIYQRGAKPYEGKIEGIQFEVSRTITSRNLGLPIIKGHIDSEANGCSIYVTIRLQDISIAVIILFVLFLSGFTGVLYILEVDEFPFLFFGVVYAILFVLSTAGFSFEADKSKEFFRELFEAEDIKELGASKSPKSAG